MACPYCEECDHCETGMVERGKVISESKTDEGWAYALESLDRDGITTPPLLPVHNRERFEVGEKAYYFFFNDGTGRVICRL